MLLARNAFALSGDRAQPININADRISLNQRTGIAIYYGHVTMAQGSLHIDADKVVASMHGNVIQQIDAYGKPVRFRERPHRQAPEITGSALHLMYTAPRHLLVLQKQVVVHQGHNSFTGASMRYNILSQQLDVAGDTAEGRVHALIVPKQARSTTKPRPSP
ncbi:MAG: lipopolysaccharide transport periplasmic protein LptA [Acidiferrobacteraceae bacterium]